MRRTAGSSGAWRVAGRNVLAGLADGVSVAAQLSGPALHGVAGDAEVISEAGDAADAVVGGHDFVGRWHAPVGAGAGLHVGPCPPCGAGGGAGCPGAAGALGGRRRRSGFSGSGCGAPARLACGRSGGAAHGGRRCCWPSEPDSSKRPPAASAKVLTGPRCPASSRSTRWVCSDTTRSLPPFSAAQTHRSRSGSRARLCAGRTPRGHRGQRRRAGRRRGADPRQRECHQHIVPGRTNHRLGQLAVL